MRCCGLVEVLQFDSTVVGRFVVAVVVVVTCSGIVVAEWKSSSAVVGKARLRHPLLQSSIVVWSLLRCFSLRLDEDSLLLLFRICKKVML